MLGGIRVTDYNRVHWETKIERLRRQNRERMMRRRLIQRQRQKPRKAGNIRIGWWIYRD
jgi:hypothetical protein